MATGGNTASDPSRQSANYDGRGPFANKEPPIITRPCSPSPPESPRKHHCRNPTPADQTITPLTGRTHGRPTLLLDELVDELVADWYNQAKQENGGADLEDFGPLR
jgi:hypothetical protein